MMKMPTNRVLTLALTLLIFISSTRALSPVSAPTSHPAPVRKPKPVSAPTSHPAPVRKPKPVSAPPPPPALAPSSLPPSPGFSGPDCTNEFLNLTSCLTYVEQGSNLTVPEKGCCPSLAGLVNSNPICLCQLLSNSDTFGIKIDDTKALTLPTICHVQTPPISLCNELGIPVSSPGALSPDSGGGVEPSGSGPFAPATSVAAAPTSAGDGSSTARIASLHLALPAIIIQLIVILI